MAATRRNRRRRQKGAQSVLGTVALASLSLPGVLPPAARAEDPPDRGVFAFKWLSYKDWQPGLDRITVRSPSFYFLLPFKSRWAFKTSNVVDSVSGATPRYHSAVSGATTALGMKDKRTAENLKVTRYFDRSSFGVGVAHSSENDYESRSASIDARFSSKNNNTTYNIGLGTSDDVVGSAIDPGLHEGRRTVEITFGVTHDLTKRDLLQVSLTHSTGTGYFNDPYKVPDSRPHERDESIALVRWNHYLESPGAVLRSSYRYYGDSFGIRAHTIEVQWVQKLGQQWELTPLLRVYSQRAAKFYYDPTYDPILGAPYPPGYLTNPPKYLSADQRLAGFGAVTVGLKIERKLGRSWTLDVQYDRYEQRGDWRVGAPGSPGLEPFDARFIETGFRRLL